MNELINESRNQSINVIREWPKSVVFKQVRWYQSARARGSANDQ